MSTEGTGLLLRSTPRSNQRTTEERYKNHGIQGLTIATFLWNSDCFIQSDTLAMSSTTSSKVFDGVAVGPPSTPPMGVSGL